MRYLAVDLGSKRVGLAVGDADSGVVSPLEVIQVRGDLDTLVDLIRQAAEDYTAGAIVVGLPLNMDGSAGPQAKLSHAFADAWHRRSSLPVHLHDERLTSHAADHRLLDRELTRKQKKGRQDAIAAQILLESFLANRSE